MDQISTTTDFRISNTLCTQIFCLGSQRTFRFAISGLLIFLFQLNIFAEGTKQLAPSSTDVTALYTNVAAYGNFASYGAPKGNRLNIHIEDPASEQVFIGLSRQMLTSNNNDGDLDDTDYYFRIVDPTGAVVYGPTLINNGSANADTWTLASTGPNTINAGGYVPFTYIPVSGAAAGDYYIEFSDNATSVSSDNISIKYWDITVASRDAAPVEHLGRIWSQKWAFRTPSISYGADPTYGSFDRPFNGTIFTYSSDGFVSEIDFAGSGFRGLSFNLAFNDFGTTAESDLLESRKSDEDANTTDGLYKLFVNEPDITVYPSGIIGQISTDPYILNCPAGDLCASYAVSLPGQVEVVLDFNSTSGAGVYDPGTEDVILLELVVPLPGEAPPYERCISWDGNDGLGNPVTLTGEVAMYLTYFQGIVHFPVYDVEYVSTGYVPSPVRPTPSPGHALDLRFDDSKIPDERFSGAADLNWDGCSPPCHDWTNFDFGDLNTINTWWYGNSVDTASTYIPGCISDLSLDKVADGSDFVVGDTVTYTLTLMNGGDATSNTQVTEVLPAGLSYLSDDGAGNYDSGTGIWTIPLLLSGASEVLNIQARITAAGSIENTTEITKSIFDDPDSTPGNGAPFEDDRDSVTITVVPPVADLSLSKTADNASVQVGEQVSFTLTVTNAGPADASTVEITDLLPSEFTYISDDSGGAYNSGTGIWLVGDLANAGTKSITIVATANQVSTPINTAEVSSSNYSDPDSTPDNNQSAEDDQSSVMITIDCTIIKRAMSISKN